MSRLISAPLDLEQIQPASYDGEAKVQLEVFSYWMDHGYPIEQINEAYTVIHDKIDEPNTGHIVLQIQTLDKPIDEADAVEDTTTQWVCDCKDYQFNKGVDLKEKRLSEWGTCKHINSVAKTEKAKNDNSQLTL